MSEARDTLVYDGDCGICRYWVSYWERQTDRRVVYRPYQEAASDFPTISLATFERAIQLIEPNGGVFSGGGDLPHLALRTWTRGLVVAVPTYSRLRCSERAGLCILCASPRIAETPELAVVGPPARAGEL
jgi:hypothetical protein